MAQLTLFEARCARCTEPCVTPICWACIETLRSMSAWDIEWWTPVSGFEDDYHVSNLGRVRSLDRMVWNRSKLGKLYPLPIKGRVMSAPPDGSGYPGIGRIGRVHRLVLASFVGPCPPGLESLHHDDVKTNNRLYNLRWGTPTENKHDQVRNGRHGMAKRTHCPQGHEYTPENTRIDHGKRRCRICIRVKNRAHVTANRDEYNARKREERRRNRDAINARRRELRASRKETA